MRFILGYPVFCKCGNLTTYSTKKIVGKRNCNVCMENDQ